MKYRKPVPAPVRQTSEPRRLLDPRRLSPQGIVLFYTVIGLLAGVTAFGGSALLWQQVEARHLADIQDTPLQSGVATIETKSVSVSRAALSEQRIRFGFRINGRVAQASTIDEARNLDYHIGDRVQVQYRTGKSGEISIEDWQPLPQSGLLSSSGRR